MSRSKTPSKVWYPCIEDIPMPILVQISDSLDSSAVHSWRNLVDHLEDYNQEDVLRLRNFRDHGGSPTLSLFRDLNSIGWTILELANLAKKAKVQIVIDVLLQYCKGEDHVTSRGFHIVTMYVGLDTSLISQTVSSAETETADSAIQSWKGAKNCSYRKKYPSTVPPPLHAMERAARRYKLTGDQSENQGKSSKEAAAAVVDTSKTTPKATPLTSLPGLVKVEYKVLEEATCHFDKTPLDSGGHKLGEGGFGEVFYCKLDIGGERIEVAVKVLRNKDDSDAAVESTFGSVNREQFATEISSLSRLSHCNLLSILAYSDDGDQLCLIYPYMVRRSLDKYLSDVSVLPPYTRVRVALNVASALDYLHYRIPGKQIVHRDVKSANVLLSSDWTAKLGDFGVARCIPSESTSLMTTTVVGTDIFMAPEYRAGTVSPAADVYAFGVLLFELLTGKRALDTIHNEETGEDNDLISYIEELEDDPMDILIGQWDKEAGHKMWSNAEKCVENLRHKRPTSEQVCQSLASLCT